jgi:methionyl aminopeptidase
MAIPIKSEQEIQIMRKSGEILGKTLAAVCERAKPGVSTKELDLFAEEFIRSHDGATPGFKGYHGFPATLCTAVDNEIVHGIPRQDQILQEGDLFTADCGVLYQGMNTDAARSMGIGEISKDKQRLLDTAKRALSAAIDMAKPGINIGLISRLIEEIVTKEGFKIIKELTGHGIGRKLHEEPIVLNYWNGDPGPILKAGMTIAIEPIFAETSGKMKTLDDKWTIVTADGSCSVQQENTVLITPTGAEILTV